MITTLLDILITSGEDLNYLLDALNVFFLLFPQSCPGRALYSLAPRGYVTRYRQYDLFDESRYVNPFGRHVTGEKLCALDVLAVFYLLIVILLEAKFFRSTFISSFHKMFPKRAQKHRLKLEQKASKLRASSQPRKKDGVQKEQKRVLALKKTGKLQSETSVGAIGLTKFYGDKKNPSVNGFSFAVNQAECFVLVGRDGSGKSTVIRLLVGSLDPTIGTSYVDGFDVNSNPKEAYRCLGYSPQESDALPSRLTGSETLTHYARLRGLPESTIPNTVDKLWKDMHLDTYADKDCSEYTDGDRRKLSVAIALVGDPTVIFLDEPTRGLDPKSKRIVWGQISKSVEFGKYAVLTTDDMKECEALSNRLGVMDNGQLQFLGSIQQLRRSHGGGYTAEICLHKMENDRIVRDQIERIFSGAISKHLGGLRNEYQSTPQTNLSEVVRALNRLHPDSLVKYYSVKRTPLDQVFIDLTQPRTKEVSKNKASFDPYNGSSFSHNDSTNGKASQKDHPPTRPTTHTENMKAHRLPRSLNMCPLKVRKHIFSGYFIASASLILLGGLAFWKPGARSIIYDCGIYHEDDAFQLNFLPHLRKTIIRKLIRARQVTRSAETMLIIEDIINLLRDTEKLNETSIPTRAQKQKQQQVPEVCPEYWDDPRKDNVYFENVYKTKPCRRIPLEKLVEILIYAESCEDGKHLLDRIRLVYPNMTVRLAVGESGEESAICRLLESAHPLFNVKDNASTWLKLARIASSKYVLVGRNMVEFTFHTNIDRLLRVVNNLSVSVAGGSVRLEPEGRWYSGCYQTMVRNFTIRIRPGHDFSAQSCAFCDYIASPFLIERRLLIRALDNSKMQGISAFVDMFLRFSNNYNQLGYGAPLQVVACVDVLFHVAGHSSWRGYGVAETPKDSWTALARSWVINRMTLPGGIDHRWNCEQVGIKCNAYKKPGLVMPGCCLEDLSRCVKGFIELSKKHGISICVYSGNVVGAIKMPGGILPWERDSDIGWDAEKYAKMNEIMRKELYEEYGCKLGNMEYKTKFKEDIASCRTITNHSCLYFPLFIKSWRIELYGEPNVESEPLHGLKSHTLVVQDGTWAPTYLNPGLVARNMFGDNILGHTQHWVDYGANGERNQPTFSFENNSSFHAQ
ncbi:unnamed protein product [Calicophoron daubneyi]|uniref:ABC transporter domain-containing protein n=1 Tax=Calicophoron daubneyi TaxID=300641 RepID=A0AAV2SXP1_CALDB